MASNSILDGVKALTLKGVSPVGKELGRGAYGKVFTVKYGGVVCAAKEIHSILLEDQDRDYIINQFKRECINLNSVNHPNIVRFVGVYYSAENPEIPIMVMELLDTSLSNLLENKPGQLDMQTKFSILYDVCSGLSYLHGRKPAIIHRDLSSKNVLLTSYPIAAKISDLGVAKIIRADSRKTQSKLTMNPGTPDFMPPETVYQEDEKSVVYDKPVDVFSFGGISLHLFSEQWPSPSMPTRMDKKTKIIVGLTEAERRQKYLNKMTGEVAVLRPVIEQCLANDPDDRPQIEEVSRKLELLKVRNRNKLHTSN